MSSTTAFSTDISGEDFGRYNSRALSHQAYDEKKFQSDLDLAIANSLKDHKISAFNKRLSDTEALQAAIRISSQTNQEEKKYQSDLAQAIKNSLLDQKSFPLYDAFVIGSGPSAHSFAANAIQDKLNIALALGENPGGAINVKTTVRNFAGLEEKYGYELAYDWIQKSEKLGVPLLQETVTHIDLTDSIYKIQTSLGNTYTAKSIVFAQGTKPRPLTAKNIDRYKVWEDDAWHQIGDFKRAAKDRKVLVVGAGIDSVNKVKNLIEGGAHKVYIALRGSDIPAHIQELKELFPGKVEVILNKELDSIEGKNHRIRGVRMKDKSFLAVDMIVNAIGRIGNQNINIVSKNPFKKDSQSDRFIVSADFMTNIPGVFAIGDIAAQEDSSGQVIQDDGRAAIAIGKGASGERGVVRYLSSKKVKKS